MSPARGPTMTFTVDVHHRILPAGALSMDSRSAKGGGAR